MVQGSKPLKKRPGQFAKKNTSSKQHKLQSKAFTKKGNASRNKFGRDRVYGNREIERQEVEISKAIAKKNEKTVAGKLLQSGNMLTTLKEVQRVGKEHNKEVNRSMVKKKLSKVEEKIKELTSKADEKGLLREKFIS
jgi:hypothetical protein